MRMLSGETLMPRKMCIRDSVAAEVHMAEAFFGLDQVRRAVACHAAARYDRLFRQSGKQILEQHSLLIRLVKRLHDHITAGEQPLHVGRRCV